MHRRCASRRPVAHARAVDALDDQRVADRDVGQEAEMRVAMRGDDRVAVLAGLRRAVGEPGPHASVRPVAPASTRRSACWRGASRLRDRPRVGPRPRRGRVAARLRALPRDLEQRLADVRLGEDRDRHRRSPRPRPAASAYDNANARSATASDGEDSAGGEGETSRRRADRRACVAGSAAEGPPRSRCTRTPAARRPARRTSAAIGVSPRARGRRASHASRASTKPTTSSSGAGVAVGGSVPTKPPRVEAGGQQCPARRCARDRSRPAPSP